MCGDQEQGRDAMVTIKDIAREVGLSVTTVSRALSDYDDVAEATKTRIREVARRLDYHPNSAARSLQNSRSNALGLVIPLTLHRTYDAFWLEFIGGMAVVCARHGFDLSLSAAGGSSGVPDTFQRWARGRRVDGLVICDVQSDDQRVAYLQKHRVPFVAFGRTSGEADYPYVDVDGTTAVFQAVLHLTQLGHTRIAYLGIDPAFGFSRFRLMGYREALARAGLGYDLELVHEGLAETTAAEAARKLCTMPNRPTAVFAAADFLALAALRAARSSGMSVPDDLSIVVFDDNLPVQQADPPLTAISQPNRRLGEEAAALLLDRVANPDGPLVQRLIVPSLIVRSSTASAPFGNGRRSGAARSLDGTASNRPVAGAADRGPPVARPTHTGGKNARKVESGGEHSERE
jgi:LacI family transcriptional regulator